MKHVLAIDEGTTGVTCLVVAEDGRIAGRGYREITQRFPRPGWVEHDANELFDLTIAAGREALQAAGGVVPDAIGITNQRETIVVWERATGRPVYNAIVWQDRRTAARCAELAPQASFIRERTGLVIDPYFSATKLEWLVKERRLLETHRAEELAAGTVDAWLVWRLTRGVVHATDHTNASRTMLYDIHDRAWSNDLCALFGVPRSMLPEVRMSSGDFGVASAEFFGARVPIAGVAGDQQAALFGQGCWHAGQGKNTYGTGAFVLLNAGAACPVPGEGLVATVACDAAGQPAYALEASIFIAGAAVQWLRDGLGIVHTAAETEPLAASLDSNDGVYFVPALVGLGAPAWEPAARGTIVGLTRGTTRAHLARAALEAMAYATADVLEAMSASGGAPFERLRVDGGASQNDWLMQFQADVLGTPVERPQNVETTAFGAAGLAGIATGVWSDAEHFLARQQMTAFTPRRPAEQVAQWRRGWQRAMRTTLGWARDAGEG
ncbi:MAG TPA: glycerol kinase GlpK [Gemmatimonadaceae bacterium]|nr:glycerol kinase GlpK [Gemmatimonadaceae bacterium]